ncbi:hypothetical protein I4U23_014200 [Adineta vaga]|nr:hypothetical protein I4U23_014200 [Adineta vaga]
MGNTTSEVSSGVKAQINSDGQGPELYRFVDLKGGGELIDVMRLANRTKDYTHIDALIREHMPKFLYNDGEGKPIKISEIVRRRNNTFNKLKNIVTPAKIAEEEQINGEDTKHVCWDLDLRGGVGEHILHICFLSSSPVHSALAKRLLRYYPRLIDDLYMADEYYGENVLHIAIVNEEPATVKFLLDAGVDFTQRCCGKFFCPEDQKSSRVDNVTKECPEVSVATNYDGYCYFGEYALSFAAVLQQEESVRLLVAKGADTNYLLYELGASLDIKNRQGLTPLTLAAVKARKEMFDHILQKIRTIYWQYGNVTCAGYPLADIDTIGKDGSLSDTSALNIIVRGESAGHLDMMDGLIVQLLNEKWRTFIKFKFFQRMAMFTLYFSICLLGLLLRGYYHLPDACLDKVELDKSENTYKSVISNKSECQCHYTNFLWHKPIVNNENNTILNSTFVKDTDHTNNIRGIFEPMALMLNLCDGLSVLGAIIYLLMTIQEFSYQNFQLDAFIYVNDPSRILFLFSCILTIAMLPARFTCSLAADDILCVFATLTRAPYFFFFCRGFRTTGPFVVMIYTMIRGDLLRFCLIFLVFMFGFTQALHVLFVRTACENEFATVIETFFHMFCVTLQQVTDAYENLNRHPIVGIRIIGKIWFVTYIIMAAVLLFYLVMGNTYAMVNERKKEWLRQWAKIMLIVEQSVSRKERLAQQSNYSRKMTDSSRVLVTRLIQTADERASIENMRTLYYEQLQRHLEPESVSIHSKTKSIAAISQHSSSLHGAVTVRNKQEIFRNHQLPDSFSSFDTAALI